MNHYPKPREKQRTGNFPYKFKITEDYTYHDTNWNLAEEFDSQWLRITTNGVITVKVGENGYAWDGCTPKKSVFNLVILGVPDGHVDHRTMKPFTYYASLIHDALYQYLDTVPVSKAEIDRLFKTMLGDFKLRHVYYLFVKHLGGRGVIQKGLVSSESLN